jgi:hypothetical protein
VRTNWLAKWCPVISAWHSLNRVSSCREYSRLRSWRRGEGVTVIHTGRTKFSFVYWRCYLQLKSTFLNSSIFSRKWILCLHWILKYICKSNWTQAEVSVLSPGCGGFPFPLYLHFIHRSCHEDELGRTCNRRQRKWHSLWLRTGNYEKGIDDYLEDGGIMFLRNVCIHQWGYMAS